MIPTRTTSSTARLLPVSSPDGLLMNTVPHDNPDWNPRDAFETSRQLDGIRHLGSEAGSAIDLGCGTGRILVPLAQGGMRILGIDRDHEAIEQCRNAVPDCGGASFLVEDFLGPGGLATIEPESSDLVLCLGNTVMLLLEHESLHRLFAMVRRVLQPGGVFVIDDFSIEAEHEIESGNWQDGVSEDGSMQFSWIDPGSVFCIRHGSDVDPDRPPHEGDQPMRAWTTGELRSVAKAVGLGLEHLPEYGLFSMTIEPGVPPDHVS